ncbi:hypothetical protein BASA61_001104 [Batrachochytrium salamandrivorans]|nr:hypothetical protein BASA61_001104 [Batrachochytrium salamandrivorans]
MTEDAGSPTCAVRTTKEIEEQIELLTRERNEAVARIEKTEKELAKERSLTLQVIKDKADVEKQLKRVSVLANRTRDKLAVQTLIDENSKLKTELEILGDQKMQNDALKENMHMIVMQADTHKKKLEAQVAHLMDRLSTIYKEYNVQADATIEMPTVTSEDSADKTKDCALDTASIEIMRSQIKVLEATQADLRADKASWEGATCAIKFELEEVKAQLDTERKRTGASGEALGPLAAAGLSAKTWWTRPNQTAGQSQPQPHVLPIQGSGTLSGASTVAQSLENIDDGRLFMTNGAPVSALGGHRASVASLTAATTAPTTAPASTQAPVATTRTTWWNRPTTLAAPVVLAAVADPAPTTGSQQQAQRSPLTPSSLGEIGSSTTSNIAGCGLINDNTKATPDEIAQLQTTSAVEKNAHSGLTPTSATKDHGSEVFAARTKELEIQLEQHQLKVVDLQERLDVTQKSLESFQALYTTLQSDHSALEKKNQVDMCCLTEQANLIQAGQTLADSAKVESEFSLGRIKQLEEQIAAYVTQTTVAQTEMTDLQSRLADTVSQLEKATLLKEKIHIATDSECAVSTEANIIYHQAEIAEMKKNLTTLEEQHVLEVQRLLETHAINLQQLRSTLESEQNSKCLSDMSQLSSENTEKDLKPDSQSDSTEIPSLQCDHLDHQKPNETALSKLIDAKDQEITAQKAAHAAEIAVVEAKWKEKCDQQLEDARSELDKVKSELQEHAEETRKAELKEIEVRLTLEHEEKLKQLHTTHNARIAELEMQKLQPIATETSVLDSSKNQHEVDPKLQETLLRNELEKIKVEFKLTTASHEELMNQMRATDAILNEKTKQLDTLQKNTTAKLAEKEVKLTKCSEELAQLKKQMEVSVKEMEALQKQMSKQKEVSDTLIKSLQEQLALFYNNKEVDEKRIRGDLAEKSKKDRVDLDLRTTKEKHDLEERLQKEKTEIEDRFKRERVDTEERNKKEKTRLVADIEKLRKEFEAFKTESTKKYEKDLVSKTEEAFKAQQQLKPLESKLASLKLDSAQSIESLTSKVSDLTKQLSTNAAALDKSKMEETTLDQLLHQTKEENAAIQSKLDILTQELEVSRASNERSSKILSEREETLKKLKTRNDELTHAELSLKRTVNRIEKERDDVVVQIAAINTRQTEQDTMAQSQKAELDAAKLSNESAIAELSASIVKLTEENRQVVQKLAEAENGVKIVERKSAQLVKDLQKQLLKERKQREDEDATSQPSTASLKTSGSSTLYGNASHSHLNDPQSSNPKMDRLTGDLLSMAQENEVLNRRVRHAEDELASASDRINSMTDELDHRMKELEQKSKVFQQYILQEHASALQPDNKPRTAQSFNMNILSSATAMHKIDPAILTSINMKMQKLLEELTSKMIRMETTLKQHGIEMA